MTLDEIARIYDASQHPDVASGRKTEEEVLQEFMSMWDKEKDGIITFEEFKEYYEDVSANIDND